MELAKIRNKARQQSAGGLTEESSLETVAVCHTTAEVPPALSLSETITDETLDTQSALVSFPGPIVVHPVVPAPRFDPLAVILGGREHDRSSVERAHSERVDEPVKAIAEPVFEEFLCFRLGDEEYGINIMEIKEIIKPRELTEVPRTPDFVDGVLSLRGVIVPVFNMRQRLAMSLLYDKGQERIIIVRCDEGLHGLRVDRVTDVVRIVEGAREATPSVLEGIAREFVGGIGRAGSRMIIILDVCKVVDTALGEVF
jgi:purine-binding chemotaxis protein CheW